MPSTPVDRAALAAPAAVGGGAFGPTRSVAVSERGHGQHLLQQDLKPVRQLRARAQDLGADARESTTLGLRGRIWVGDATLEDKYRNTTVK